MRTIRVGTFHPHECLLSPAFVSNACDIETSSRFRPFGAGFLRFSRGITENHSFSRQSHSKFHNKPDVRYYHERGFNAVAADLVELILNPVKDPGQCSLCETNITQDQCASCKPNHYLCSDCYDRHRDEVRFALGK